MRNGGRIEGFKGAFGVAVMERLCLREGESPKNSAGEGQGEGGSRREDPAVPAAGKEMSP